jgi:putative ABC transport system permease protein
VSALTRLVRRTIALLRKRELERDMEHEMQLHIEFEAEELARTRGLSRSEALRQARIAFGGVEQFKESGRDARGTRLLEDLAADARYAIRTLRNSPGFAIAAAITMALGIGVTTALFGVVHAALLEPLPFGDPAHTVAVWSSWKDFARTWISYDEYELLLEQPRLLDAVGLYTVDAQSLTGSGEPERVHAAQVSHDFLQAIGVAPALGRAFLAAEDVPGSNDVALLGYALWQRRFAGDPSIVGRSIDVGGRPTLVVGVMPASFRMPLDYTQSVVTELLTPLATTAADNGAIPGPAVTLGGGSHSFYAVAHLAPGVTAAQTNQVLRDVTTRLTKEGAYPPGWHFAMTAIPLREQISGGIRPILFVLLGAVALVLLIACANVAGLLFVRMERRRRETGLRVALGAARGRLARQFLTEGVVIALAGGALGLLVAWLGVAATRAWAPASLPLVASVELDLPVLAFALATTLGTVVLFALAPALAATRVHPANTLRDGGRGATSGRERLRARQMLVVGEVALAVVLIVGGGLMIRTVQRMLAIDPGFRSDHVLTMELSLPSSRYPDARVASFFEELRHRVDALPGVRRSAAARLLPLSSEIGDWGLRVDGYTPPPLESTPGDWQIVTPGYFQAMGLRLISGRTFDERDQTDSPPVIVISERMAEKYFAGRDALGGRVQLSRPNGPWAIVVGVVRNVEHNSLIATEKPAFYALESQWHAEVGFTPRTMNLVVSTVGDPLALVRAVRGQVRALDPQVPLAHVRTLDDIVQSSVSQQRFAMLLLDAFAALALALAVVGIYGVIAQVVASRRQDFGVRLALGATPDALVRLSLWDGVRQTGAGLVLGALAALVLTRLMHGMLYGVTPTDPATFAVALLVTGVVATAAIYLPARRAGRIDPASALGAE